MRIKRSASVTRIAIVLALSASSPGFPDGRIFAQETTPVRKLNITILEGEGAINNIKTRVASEPVVQVTDENRKPVGGALLSFTLPNSGPSGTFANGSRVLSVTTDQNGRAVAQGLRPNKNAGQYNIQVSASFQGLTATAVITQSNALGAAAASAGGLFGIGVPATIAVVGGVAAATIFGLTKVFGGGGKNARVTLGQPTIP